MVLIPDIPRLTFNHFLILTTNTQIVSIRFIQKMSFTSIPFLQRLMVNSFRMTVKSIQVETTFHEKEVHESQLSKNKWWLGLLVNVLAHFFHVFCRWKVRIEPSHHKFVELCLRHAWTFLHHVHHLCHRLRLLRIVHVKNLLHAGLCNEESTRMKMVLPKSSFLSNLNNKYGAITWFPSMNNYPWISAGNWDRSILTLEICLRI